MTSGQRYWRVWMSSAKWCSTHVAFPRSASLTVICAVAGPAAFESDACARSVSSSASDMRSDGDGTVDVVACIAGGDSGASGGGGDVAVEDGGVGSVAGRDAASCCERMDRPACFAGAGGGLPSEIWDTPRRRLVEDPRGLERGHAKLEAVVDEALAGGRRRRRQRLRAGDVERVAARRLVPAAAGRGRDADKPRGGWRGRTQLGRDPGLDVVEDDQDVLGLEICAWTLSLKETSKEKTDEPVWMIPQHRCM
jgi:hypothetical protein